MGERAGHVRIANCGIVRFRVYNTENKYLGLFHVTAIHENIDVFFTEEIAKCVSIDATSSYEFTSDPNIPLEGMKLRSAPDES